LVADAEEAVEPRPSFLRQLGRYFRLTLRQAYEDSIPLTASALAFITFLSLIPLLTAFSFIGARVFHQYPQRSLEVFVQVLPYSDKTVVDKFREFLDQAETLHGFGVGAFFFTTLFAFATIEEALNKIWNVSKRRPVRNRLLSFLLLLFWGPLLIGVTFSSLILLRQSPALRMLVERSILLSVAPLLATVIGLTTLYWLVPYTTVRLRSALAGALLAAILLELLRLGFAAWFQVFRSVNVVYGSFAFAFLFMLSLDLAWTMILFGNEASYTAQHFRVLSRGMHRNPPVQAAWVGLASLVLIASRFACGEPVLSLSALADRLSLPTRELERILRPLLTHDLLRALGDRGYVLAVDPHRLRVNDVFLAYDHRAVRGAELAGDGLQKRLEALIGELAGARAERLGPLTVAELVSSGKAGLSEGPVEPEEEVE
jgi:membrane protein